MIIWHWIMLFVLPVVVFLFWRAVYLTVRSIYRELRKSK